MTKTIAGIEFEAVRIPQPRLHWKAKVVQTGKTLDCFRGSGSREALFDDIQRVATAVDKGSPGRFARDTLSA